MVSHNKSTTEHFDETFYSLLRSPSGESLSAVGNELMVSGSAETYQIIDGVPRFVAALDQGQEQVQGTFAYKWNRAPDFGITGATADIMTQWMMPTLGWKDESEYAEYLRPRKVMLDAGCGNGRETIRLARLNPEALVIGIDISEAVDQAAKCDWAC